MAPVLEPRLRGLAAYFYDRRYLRFEEPRPARALEFFQAALANAPPESCLCQLVQAELDQLQKK